MNLVQLGAVVSAHHAGAQISAPTLVKRRHPRPHHSLPHPWSESQLVLVQPVWLEADTFLLNIDLGIHLTHDCQEGTKEPAWKTVNFCVLAWCDMVKLTKPVWLLPQNAILMGNNSLWDINPYGQSASHSFACRCRTWGIYTSFSLGERRKWYAASRSLSQSR